ncbi:unnamed protein product, partial [Musa textilis]
VAAHRRHLATPAPLLLLALASAVAAASSFDEANPIRSVVDRVENYDAAVIGTLGRARHALDFARFAHRYGSAAEIRRRFGIFLRNLELIRSTNRRSLPCTLG